MSLFLDCEFNGHEGRLISMGIVSDLTQQEFYETLIIPHDEVIDPWVQENVIPKLYKPPIDDLEFREKLHIYLLKHTGETIYADSPADHVHLLNNTHWMNDENSYRYLSLELTMKFIIPNRKEYWPTNELEHHALHDARTLMKWANSPHGRIHLHMRGN